MVMVIEAAIIVRLHETRYTPFFSSQIRQRSGKAILTRIRLQWRGEHQFRHLLVEDLRRITQQRQFTPFLGCQVRGH